MAKKRRKERQRKDRAGRRYTEAVPNRNYKSTIFTMLLQDKEKLLEVYNAVSGKHYTDSKLLEINTLENAIYMSMKNDVSFLIDSRLSLYEHQSTYSPNLPFRMLLYLADLYAGMTKDDNLYGTRKVLIPPPQFIIFYNGQEEQPEMRTLRLSDLYGAEEKEHKLELEAVMLNVNAGHNPKLMEACRTLREYAEYTDRVRRYAKRMTIADAVERAITECIRKGILRDFLEKNRAEAKRMSIYEYDQEKHMRQEREASWEDGREVGKKEEKRLVAKNLMQKGMEVKEIAQIIEEKAEVVEKWMNEESSREG